MIYEIHGSSQSTANFFSIFFLKNVSKSGKNDYVQRRLADKTGSWQRFLAGLTSEPFGWWGMLGVATIPKGGHLGSSWSSRKKEKKLLVNLYCLCIVHTSINLIDNVVICSVRLG